MKLKYKPETDKYTLKNLSYVDMQLIRGLLNHVRLGSLNRHSESAFQLMEVIDSQDISFEDIGLFFTNNEGEGYAINFPEDTYTDHD
jgi:hypothetical protein